jgi:signal transduction protein with GAF and PtsI domain
MSEKDGSDINEKLRRLIETIDIANLLTEPLTKSIENLLRVSAAEVHSDEASVLIRDGDEGDLRFLSAIGTVADQLLNLRVPAGKGIAGFVMSSGQPMVVSDVGEEQSFYAEVDKKTGYSTQMILATPLRHNDEVIGVLEYINRTGEPPYEPFTPEEMDKAALCAEAIASLVNAYEAAKLLRDLSERMLSDAADVDAHAIREWLIGVRDTAEHREMMELAVLLRELASRGDAERRLCRGILESMLNYSDVKNEISFLNY